MTSLTSRKLIRNSLIPFILILLPLLQGCQTLNKLMEDLGAGDNPAGQIPTHIQIGPMEPAFTETPETELGIGSTWERPADGMLMVYVPAGEFLMGSNDGESDEAPQHTVALDAFWIDQTEVTNAMYGMCEASGGCVTHVVTNSMFQTNYYGNPDYADYPTIGVSWQNASDYCSWVGGRLPSEAEWEKAARGTDGSTYPWGEGIDFSLANYAGNVGGDTTFVGSYLAGASPYGALDMAGNVSEWVNDWYDENYYSSSPFENPLGPSMGEHRVMRGGSWYEYKENLRAASRVDWTPDKMFSYNGFRCVMYAIP